MYLEGPNNVILIISFGGIILTTSIYTNMCWRNKRQKPLYDKIYLLQDDYSTKRRGGNAWKMQRGNK